MLLLLEAGCAYNFRPAPAYAAVPARTVHVDEGALHMVPVSYNFTAVALYPFGISLVRTGGAAYGPQGMSRQDFFKVSCAAAPQLKILVYMARTESGDACRFSRIAANAFRTVERLAGRPPVGVISIYLVARRYQFTIGHDSWGIFGDYSVLYVIDQGETGFERQIAGILAHELLHVWLGFSRASFNGVEEERAAFTMALCAQVAALGSVARHQRAPELSRSSVNKILAGTPDPFRDSLQVGDLEPDPALRNLFANGPIHAGTSRADALMNLCRRRANSVED